MPEVFQIPAAGTINYRTYNVKTAFKEDMWVERAEARLTSALGGINALAEAYPQLRASESFQRLQTELADGPCLVTCAIRDAQGPLGALDGDAVSLHFAPASPSDFVP